MWGYGYFHTVVPVADFTATGQQIDSVVFQDGREEVFILNGTALASYRFNPFHDGALEPSDTADSIATAITDLGLNIGELVEIAGGETLKMRYNSGIMVSVVVRNGSPIVATDDMVARVTRNGVYKFKYDFYRSGPGTAPLAPLMSNGDSDDIVAVFEGLDSDRIVRIGDIADYPIIGFVGNHPISISGSSTILKLPDGDIPIDSYGRIVIRLNAIGRIKLGTNFVQDGQIVDYSSSFPESQYGYISDHRRDWRAPWIGVGNTGHVVDLGNFMITEVDPPANDSAKNIDVNYVYTDGHIKIVAQDGSLSDPLILSDSGRALIDRLYQNDVSGAIPISWTDARETQPLEPNGFIFSYGSGRWVDANVMPPE